jgi:hypothetical protein
MFNGYNKSSIFYDMTYDSSSLNQYNYKNLDDVFPGIPAYQHSQNLFYFTRQINPITLPNVSPQLESRDPSNLPCDVRPIMHDGLDGLDGE